MPTAAIGFAAALVFGAADFLGGIAAKRSHPALVTGTVALSGLVFLGLGLAVVPGRWSVSAVVWGSLSGLAGALAIVLLYACLAIGPMSILSPLTAVVSALIPLGFGIASGERLTVAGWLGLALALVAVVLVGFVPGQGVVRPTMRALAMAVGSGTMIGAFLVLIERAPYDSGLVPLVMNRGTNALLMFAAVGVIAARRGRSSLGQGGLRIAIFGGLVDAVANSLLLVGVRLGDLAVMGVLTALYPAGTILLAAGVLKERVAVVQWSGLGLALVAIVLLAL